jgi:hypothetical protein
VSVTFVIPVRAEQATLVPLYHSIADEITQVTKIWEVNFLDALKCIRGDYSNLSFGQPQH